MARILRNGQWIEVETGPAARERRAAERAAERKELQEQLDDVRLRLMEITDEFCGKAENKARRAVRRGDVVRLASAMTDVLFLTTEYRILENEARRLQRAIERI